jgi:hypothetical protein
MTRHTPDRDRTRRDKQHLAAPPDHGAPEPLHHGKRFAETEARVRARTHAPGTGHSGSPEPASDDHLGSTDAQVSPTPSHASAGAAANETGRRGPAPVSQPRQSDPSPAAAAALLTFGSEAIDALRRLGQASRAVALLPVRAAGLLLRLSRRWLTGSPGRP